MAEHFRWNARGITRATSLAALIGAPGLLLLRDPDFAVKVLGVVWAAPFAVLALALLKRRHDRDPVVTVSAEGLRDRRISDQTFAWAAISRVEGFDAENVAFVGLEFHNPKTELRTAKWHWRLFAPMHRLLRFPSITLQMSLLDGSDADVLAAIARFRPDLTLTKT